MKTLAALLLAFAFNALAADLPKKFEPPRDPVKDVAAAQAKAENKRVLVDVGGEWCVWCHLMDDFIAANADVRVVLDANYVMVKVNWSRENKNQAFLDQFPKIKGYPPLRARRRRQARALAGHRRARARARLRQGGSTLRVPQGSSGAGERARTSYFANAEKSTAPYFAHATMLAHERRRIVRACAERPTTSSVRGALPSPTAGLRSHRS